MATKKNETIDFNSYANDIGKDFKDSVDDIDGWIKPDYGLLIHGIVRGMKWDESKGKHFYIIELKRETTAIIGKGKDAETIKLEAGKFGGLTERYKLKALRELVPNQCEFILQFTDRIDVGAGRTMWKHKLKYRGVKAPYTPPKYETEDPDSDDGGF